MWFFFSLSLLDILAAVNPMWSSLLLVWQTKVTRDVSLESSEVTSAQDEVTSLPMYSPPNLAQIECLIDASTYCLKCLVWRLFCNFDCLVATDKSWSYGSGAFWALDTLELPCLYCERIVLNYPY